MTELQRPIPIAPPLALLTIALIPFEAALPAAAGLSLASLTATLTGLFAYIENKALVGRLFRTPVFRTVVLLVLTGLAAEFIHLDGDLIAPIRILRMLFGAAGLAAVASGYPKLVIGSVKLGGLGSAFLILPSLLGLGDLPASDLVLASNANQLALFIGFSAAVWIEPAKLEIANLAAAIALTLTLTQLESRGALVALLASLTILAHRRLRHQNYRLPLMMTGTALVAYVLLTQSVTVLLRIQTADQFGQKAETRLSVYESAVSAIPEYLPFGVGSGAFWEYWAVDNGFRQLFGTEPIGPHNVLIASAVFWGIPGLLLAGYLTWIFVRHIFRVLRSPANYQLEDYTISAAVFVMAVLAFSHTLHALILTLLLAVFLGVRPDPREPVIDPSADIRTELSQR